MELIYNYVFSIDLLGNTISEIPFDASENLNRYIFELINRVTNSEGDRLYKFAETSHTMKDHVDNLILDNHNSRDISSMIASRLLDIETEAQRKIAHLVEIQRGLLLISFVKMTETEFKLIFSKADYNEFLEEISGEIKSGLPIKKKIFKAFIANISLGSGNKVLSKLMTYDSNTTIASYWWHDFLELEVVVEDKENTIRAYNGIKKDIIDLVYKNYNEDYLPLWNMTIGYFRSVGEFNLNHYRDNIIGIYIPNNVGLSIPDLKIKINNLPTKYGFDIRFDKVPDVIKKEFKNTISLTSEIDMILKHDIQNIENIIVAKMQGDDKYIMIKSNKGYDMAKKLEQNN